MEPQNSRPLQVLFVFMSILIATMNATSIGSSSNVRSPSRRSLRADPISYPATDSSDDDYGIIVFYTVCGFIATVVFCAIIHCILNRHRSSPDNVELDILSISNPVGMSILMVQIGLSGKARSLQSEIHELASSATTYRWKGWHSVLMETIAKLSSHPTYFTCACSSVERFSDIDSTEERFQEVSVQERKKIKELSLENAGKCRTEAFVVATILVAAVGQHSLPQIGNIPNLINALKNFTIGSDHLLAVEILWAPEGENETLSKHALLNYYPLLRQIR